MKKKKKDSGVAMIVVLIVGAVVLVFCLSLLLAAYTLYARTNREVTQQQCKILAQTASESLGTELSNQNSGLITYFETQIQNGSWSGGEELCMNLDDGGQSGDYHVQVTFTYSLNLPDDDGEDSGDDNDDQDTNPDNPESGNESGNTGAEGNSGTKKAGDNPGGSNAQPVGNGTYTIRAVVRCTRGDGTGKDVQYYELETEFSSVSMKGGIGSEEE